MPTGERKDPYRNSRFLVEVDGIVQAGFSAATIRDSTQEPIEYREGNETPTVRKLPGLVKYGNVTLERGITDSMDLYNCRKQVEQGKMKDARRNMAIILMDEEGSAKARWEFSNAWPSKYDAPDLDGKGNDVTIETMEIVHEGMAKVS
jgi:phage tail-like protein